MNKKNVSRLFALLTGLQGWGRFLLMNTVLACALGASSHGLAVEPPAPELDVPQGMAMPYSDRWSQQVVSVTKYPDGSIDQILSGRGRGNVLGDYSVRTQVRLVPAGVDFVARTAVFSVTGETRSTDSNGAVLTTTFAGKFEVPLDSNFQPTVGPRPFLVTWNVSGGTGRFEGAVGRGGFNGTGMSEGRFHGVSWGTIWLNPNSQFIRNSGRSRPPAP
jgi:hypothetical protein